ncbi:Gfo/Idh/MocA family oxidoreductase [Candidatus Thioglobus sp.]|nr:Gfo/Idh/MocA family oxidoreductase [Candidatus Thioglobus sp.]
MLRALMSFNVLIIGLGQIGMRYDFDLDHGKYTFSHAAAFSQHKDFNIVGGVDIDSKFGKFFTEKYNSVFYNNIQDALQKNNPDIVVIAVSTEFHNQVLKDVVKYTIPKVVLCEKPLSYSLKEARSMQKLCKDNNIQLFVNYMRNSLPDSINIKNKISNGDYAGNPKGVAWYSKGLIHNGSHFVNLLEYWLGSIKKIHCINKGRSFESQDVEPDFSLSFKKGDVIFLSAKEENFSHYGIELVFDNGRLRYDQGGKNIYWTPAEQDENLPAYKFLSSKNKNYSTDSMRKYQLHVVNELWNMLNQKDYELCSGVMAISTLESISEIIEECK